MIGKRVKEARLKAGLTLEELAERVKTTHQAIQRLETGLVRMPRNLEKLAEALNVSQEWLLTGKAEYEPDQEVYRRVSFDIKAMINAMQKLTKKQREALLNQAIETAHENEEIKNELRVV